MKMFSLRLFYDFFKAGQIQLQRCIRFDLLFAFSNFILAFINILSRLVSLKITFTKIISFVLFKYILAEDESQIY